MKKTALFIALALVAFAFTAQVQAQTLVGYRSPNPGNMNPSYEMAIEPQFDDVILDFSDGMACVMIKRGQLCNYIDQKGKPIFEQQLHRPRSFHYGAVAVENDEHKWGYMNIEGSVFIPTEYGYANDFCENFAVVSVDVTGGGHYRFTFIDLDGKLMGDPRFHSANNFSEGYTSVKLKNSNWQVLNRWFTATSGLLPYDAVDEFHEGLARVRVGERYGFIDTLGNLKIPMRDGWCSERFSEGLCVVKQGGKYGYMDMTGRIVIPCHFTFAEPFSCSRAIVSMSEPDKASGMITERGIIDHNGNWVVKEGQFDGIESFSEDYAVVAKDGKYGFINVNGRVVIEMKYEKARAFNEGYAAVKVDRKWGFLHLLDEDFKK